MNNTTVFPGIVISCTGDLKKVFETMAYPNSYGLCFEVPEITKQHASSRFYFRMLQGGKKKVAYLSHSKFF